MAVVTPFADALETAQTPADLEALLRAVNAYLAANPYAVAGTERGLCSLEHRTEARVARREAYRRLGVSSWVPGSLGRTPESPRHVTYSPDRKPRTVAVPALEVLTGGELTSAEVAERCGYSSFMTASRALNRLVLRGLVRRRREGVRVLYRLSTPEVLT